MKPSHIKALKITGIVIVSLCLLHGIATLMVNRILHDRIEQQLMDQVHLLYGQTIRYGKINTQPLSGTITVTDLYFNNTLGELLMADSIGFEIEVKKVRVTQVNFIKLLLMKDIGIRAITIDHPSMRLNLNEESFQTRPQELSPLASKEDVSTSLSASEQMLSFVARLNVDKVRIEDASISWRMLDSNMELDVEDVDLAVDNLNFDFVTQTASYNDSTYAVSIEGVSILTPDSLTYLTVGSFKTKNAGPIYIEDFTERTTVGYRELSDRSHLPEVWTSIQVEKVQTSPINIIAQVLSQRVRIDTLRVRTKTLEVFEDLRYPNVNPYDMPQEILMDVEVPLHVKYLRASIDTLRYTMANTDIHDGTLEVVRIKADIKDFGNRNRDAFSVKGSAEFVGGGKGNLQLTMKMNKACDWSIKLDAKDIQGSAFNGFLRPLFGISADLTIDEVAANYKGDKDKAAGEFKMLYHGLEVHAYKGESAYDIINKNAKAIEDLGNAFLPKSNPTLLPGSKGNLPSERPREYDVKATRDPMVKVPVYMMMPIIDGLKKTMLPGLFIQKKRKK